MTSEPEGSRFCTLVPLPRNMRSLVFGNGSPIVCDHIAIAKATTELALIVWLR